MEGREKYRLLNLATNNGCQASERAMRQRESARVPARERCRLCFATAADATVDRDPIDCRMRRGRGGQTSNSGREGTAFICYQVGGRSDDRSHRTVSVCLKIQSGLQHIYSSWQLERRGKVWTARVPLPAAEWLSW